MGRYVVLLVVLLVNAPPAAAQQATTSYGRGTVGRWKAMDRCEVQAHRAFPDYTAESNAKREARLQECLAGQMLPKREALPSTGH